LAILEAVHSEMSTAWKYKLNWVADFTLYLTITKAFNLSAMPEEAIVSLTLIFLL
jgi:hypothetical protein